MRRAVLLVKRMVAMSMRWMVSLMLMVLLGDVRTACAAPPAWKAMRVGAPDGEFVTVAAHPEQPTQLYAATRRVLYVSTDHGRRWEARFRLPGTARASRIAVSRGQPPTLLVATDRGLYGSFDDGRHWSRLFRGVGQTDNICTDVAFHPALDTTAWLATRNGLVMSRDGGRHWVSVQVPPAARDILQIAFDPHDASWLYLLAAHGLFAGQVSTGRWLQRVSSSGAEEPAVEGSGKSETGEEPDALHHLSAVIADPRQPSALFLATPTGLRHSADGGLTWRWLPRTGLTASLDSRLLLHHASPLQLYATTVGGVARYTPERQRWEPLTTGLIAARVHDLAVTPTDLWAATDQGLYRYPLDADLTQTPEPAIHEVLDNFMHEPAIHEVREAAIRYAEVHPEKIRRWRRQANLKALLPKLGFDVSRDDDLFITTRGSTSKPATDRFLIRQDPSRGMDVSLTWDLGELLWNNDQTSIDVRSKLMVQLREDIVEAVTRTYFERRRLQVRLLTAPPTEWQARLEQELRIRELTALLDGFTDGLFLRALELHDN